MFASSKEHFPEQDLESALQDPSKYEQELSTYKKESVTEILFLLHYYEFSWHRLSSVINCTLISTGTSTLMRLALVCPPNQRESWPYI